jgi:DnaJ domain
MQLVLISLGVLAALAFGLPAFSRANPAQLARLLKIAGGAVLVGLALLLLARGQFHFALLVLGVGFPLLLGKGGRLFGGKPKSAGQTSEVATALVRMRLDHDSGAMDGEVLGGRFKGRQLAELEHKDLMALLLECRASDPRSLSLMEAYLDHRFPDWRGAATGEGGTSDAGTPDSSAGPMTLAEARQILGVGPKASDEDIRAAWRELMKRNHPDQGGSSYIAAKINEAKDVLLRHVA